MQTINDLPMPHPNIDTSAEPKVETSPRKMSMAVINFWLDAALFVNVIFIMWVSVMLQFIFPEPTESVGWKLWGMSYNEWRNVQFGALCTFALLAIEHLVLHWNWVCSIIATKVLRAAGKPDEGEQAVYGVGTFIGVLVLVMSSLVAALFSVQAPH
jgi:hypothetical protein